MIGVICVSSPSTVADMVGIRLANWLIVTVLRKSTFAMIITLSVVEETLNGCVAWCEL